VALGATRSTVIQHVLSETMWLTLLGLVIGCFAALGLTRFMTSLLFGVTASDLVTYLGVSCVLGGIAFIAGYLPARRATAVDPLIALRQE
jgi:putative ABC transport system permease protein